MEKKRYTNYIICAVILALGMAITIHNLTATKNMYLAGSSPKVKAFTQELEPADPLVRGSLVQATHRKIEGPEGQPLVKVHLEAGDCYVPEDALTEDANDTVRETAVYVRTPVTLYGKSKGPEIAGFAPKGSKLTVKGYDRIQKDGRVNKYKVQSGQTTGWVYGKYLVFSEKAAKRNCNDKGAYDMAKDAKFIRQLYGGKATHLDYFPYERTQIKGKKLCRDARAIYLNAGAAVKDKYFELAKHSGANAVVINIDGGTLAYKSPVAKELCPTAYGHAHRSVEKYRKAVKRYQDAGFYTIGRIVCFHDENYAKDHKKACITVNGERTRWVSAYNRGCWHYKVALATEAVDLFGFDEIQFDYVRFPESSYQWSAQGGTDFKNTYHEEKAQAIQNFCFYAADQIHEAGAYFSVDVFGESSNGYVTAYGQYWPAISNIVDVISSMPYSDHHGENDTWTHPYNTLYHWAKHAAKMQRHIPTPAAARTWITGYDTPYWAPSVDYDYSKLNEQVKALKDAGLYDGFIPWNSSSDYRKYKEYEKIWRK